MQADRWCLFPHKLVDKQMQIINSQKMWIQGKKKKVTFKFMFKICHMVNKIVLNFLEGERKRPYTTSTEDRKETYSM